MTYGYAASADPESLQVQVEALEDAGIPKDRLYVELTRHSQPERARFKSLAKVLKRGDYVVVYDMSALGSGLLESYDRLKQLDKRKVHVEIIHLPDGESQDQVFKNFRYLADMYTVQREQEPIRGHPRSMYPPGWREAYINFIHGKKTAAEICAELGIPDYDFYRMRNRYEQSLKERKNRKKNSKKRTDSS